MKELKNILSGSFKAAWKNNECKFYFFTSVFLMIFCFVLEYNAYFNQLSISIRLIPLILCFLTGKKLSKIIASYMDEFSVKSKKNKKK